MEPLQAQYGTQSCGGLTLQKHGTLLARSATRFKENEALDAFNEAVLRG